MAKLTQEHVVDESNDDRKAHCGDGKDENCPSEQCTLQPESGYKEPDTRCYEEQDCDKQCIGEALALKKLDGDGEK